jgi:predicted Fe-Mo cluster-binding NifX family protein
MIVCIPVDGGGTVDPRWGRAARVALASVEDGAIVGWEELDVGWDALHDAGSEAGHHARVARFLRDHHVDVVVADHMGGGMRRMLDTMRVSVHLGAGGHARDAVLEAVRS